MQKNRKLLYPLLTLCFFLLLGAFYLGRRSVGVPVLTTQHRGTEQTAPARSGQPPDVAGTAQTDAVKTGLNLNTATLQELIALPGIGEVLANRILTYRAENGPFRTATELMNVSGIGEKTFAGLRDLVYVEDIHENTDH